MARAGGGEPESMPNCSGRWRDIRITESRTRGTWTDDVEAVTTSSEMVTSSSLL